MLDSDLPVWAVLARVSEERLRALTAELWPGAADDPHTEIEWRFAAGDRGWSAAYTAEADALAVGEERLAGALARRLGSEVYLLFFDHDAAEPVDHLVYRHAPGARPAGSEESPYEVAGGLGVALPGRPLPYRPRADAGAMVAGVGADEVRAALGETIDPEVVRIDPVAPGTFVHSRRGSANFGIRLSALFPDHRVYDVIRHQDTGRFVCTLFGDGEAVERLVWPADEDVNQLVPRVDEILGAREPDALLAALGILELLGAESGGADGGS
jgi:hypothetical protein